MKPLLVMLPGLGADARLFDPQRRVFPDLVVPPWPKPGPDDTLTHYAARVAETIPKDRPSILCGASFGGMVALEASSMVLPRGVVLIGSCRSPSCLAPTLRHLGVVTPLLPQRTHRPARWWRPVINPLFGPLDASQRDLFWDMLAGTEASFLQWGVSAILAWKPSPPQAPVHHIHGRADRLIPLRRVKPDRVLDGGHLLTLTHADDVNDLLRDLADAPR